MIYIHIHIQASCFLGDGIIWLSMKSTMMRYEGDSRGPAVTGGSWHSFTVFITHLKPEVIWHISHKQKTLFITSATSKYSNQTPWSLLAKWYLGSLHSVLWEYLQVQDCSFMEREMENQGIPGTSSTILYCHADSIRLKAEQESFEYRHSNTKASSLAHNHYCHYLNHNREIKYNKIKCVVLLY